LEEIKNLNYLILFVKYGVCIYPLFLIQKEYLMQQIKTS